MTFGGLDSLFNPAKRHMDEEKQRLQSTREEVGDASGGKRIDLDSGRVKLGGRRGRRADATSDDVSDEDNVNDMAAAGNTGDTGIGTDESPAIERSTKPAKESAAVQRARQRRRKTGAS